VATGPTGGCQHNYSTKTRKSGCDIEQTIYSLLSMAVIGKWDHLYMCCVAQGNLDNDNPCCPRLHFQDKLCHNVCREIG